MSLGDGWLVGRKHEVGLQSESRGAENSKRTGEPATVSCFEVQLLSFLPMLLALRPRRSLLAIPPLHIEYKSEGVAPETPPGMTTAMCRAHRAHWAGALWCTRMIGWYTHRLWSNIYSMSRRSSSFLLRAPSASLA